MDFQFATVIAALEGNSMHQASHGPGVIFPKKVTCLGKVPPGRGEIKPRGSGDARDPVLRGNLAFIYIHFGKVACLLVPFERVGGDTRDVNFAAKVTGEVTEMGSLFNDRTSAE